MGKSVPRDGAAPGPPPVLGLRPKRAIKGRQGPQGAENEMTSSDLEQRLEEKVGSEKAAAYLEFEDFSHTGLGLETYEDGLQHPIELRRILTGDLSLEMSVSFQARADDVFQTLDYPSKKKKTGVEILDSHGRSVYSSFSMPQH